MQTGQSTKRPTSGAAIGKRAVVIVAILLMIAATFATTGAAAAEDDLPAVRERYGPGVVGDKPVDPTDGETITSFTPSLTLGGEPGEIVLRDATDAVVTTSGQQEPGAWVVGEGILSPGGSYSWDAIAPVGDRKLWISAPSYEKDVGFADPLEFGGPWYDVASVQGAQSFGVATGFGLNSAASGLSARFWPHVDFGNDETVDSLPPVVRPAAGSATLEVVSDVGTHGRSFETCDRKIVNIGGQTVQHEVVHCKEQYGVEVTYTDRPAGAEVAAHNIEGTNAAPSFQMTVTADQLVDPDGGFVMSTAGGDLISAAFPLQSGFGYRMLGYLEVPETGTYTFGTTSPAGSRAYLYDTTDTDLGRTEITAPDAWVPAELSESCSARSDVRSFSNNVVDYYYSPPPSGSTGPRQESWTWFFQYDEDDASWFQFPDEGWEEAIDRLQDPCAADDTIRWGEAVTLEAGRQYPIDLSGWVGVVGGAIGLHVIGPDGEPMPVPVDWLTPAPSNVLDFERSQAPVNTLDANLVAWAMNGYGDELVGVDPDHGLVTYTANGLGGWNPAGGVSDLVPLSTRTYTLDSASVLDRDSGSAIDATNTTGRIVVGDRIGRLHGAEITASGSQTVGPFPKTAELFVDELEVQLDANGDVVDSQVTGRLTSTIGAAVVELTDVTGHRAADGTLQLTLRDQWGQSRAELTLHPERPTFGPTSGSVSQSGTRVGTKLHGSQPATSVTGAIDIVDGRGSIDGESIVAAVELHMPGWIENYQLTLDRLKFDVDPEGTLANIDADGELYIDAGKKTSYELGAVTGSIDLAGGKLILTVPAVGGPNDSTLVLDLDQGPLTDVSQYPSTGIAVDDPGETLVIATDPSSAGDVAIVSKRDTEQPFADGNVDITSVNDLYVEAGMDVPTAAGDLPQAVQITPDGLTVGVLQPDGDGHRVDIIDRSREGAPWTIIGSFPVTGTAQNTLATVPFAVGRDGSFRYVALANGSEVEVHVKTGTAPWSSAGTFPMDAPVTSMSFDYFAEKLAVGQPAAGQVSVLERSGTTTWAPGHTLTSSETPQFGSTVQHTWGLLSVTGDGVYHCDNLSTLPQACGEGEGSTPGQARLYRDSTGVWDDYRNWTTLDLGSGTGPHAVVAQGGATTRPVIAAATVTTLDTGRPGTLLPGQAEIQLY